MKVILFLSFFVERLVYLLLLFSKFLISLFNAENKKQISCEHIPNHGNLVSARKDDEDELNLLHHFLLSYNCGQLLCKVPIPSLSSNVFYSYYKAV